MFNKNAILAKMETMRLPNGLFIASPTPDYDAVWLRDTLYCTFCYWYLMDAEGEATQRAEYEGKLQEGMWAVFDLLQKYRRKIYLRISSPREISQGTLHAKFGHEGQEITGDNEWGHHQLDVLGIFLYLAADMYFKNVRILRDEKDRELLQFLVWYARSAEYWRLPDFGMWEECTICHASSIGAVLAGLSYLQRLNIVEIADTLIHAGRDALFGIPQDGGYTTLPILPHESLDVCRRPHHRHDCDVALLALIWPYHIVEIEKQDELIARVVHGHTSELPDEDHKLLQTHGFNRYWGDDYYRSTEGKWRGISAEWPMFFFWLSIIYSQRREYDTALEWFQKGAAQIHTDEIPEAYQNGNPNDHTPLAWAHAIALIAFCKLPADMQEALQ